MTVLGVLAAAAFAAWLACGDAPAPAAAIAITALAGWLIAREVARSDRKE